MDLKLPLTALSSFSSLFRGLRKEEHPDAILSWLLGQCRTERELQWQFHSHLGIQKNKSDICAELHRSRLRGREAVTRLGLASNMRARQWIWAASNEDPVGFLTADSQFFDSFASKDPDGLSQGQHGNNETNEPTVNGKRICKAEKIKYWVYTQASQTIKNYADDLRSVWSPTATLPLACTNLPCPWTVQEAYVRASASREPRFLRCKFRRSKAPQPPRY